MWPEGFFPSSYFADGYWPKEGGPPGPLVCYHATVADVAEPMTTSADVSGPTNQLADVAPPALIITGC
jgi:hypothetical protein